MSTLIQNIVSDASTHDVVDEGFLGLPDRLLDVVPAGLYVCDQDGVILRYNRRAADLWGRAPKLGDPVERYCGSYRMYRLDGVPLPHSDCPMANVLRTGMAVRDHEVVIERPDGVRAVALVNIDVLKDAAGTIVGAVSCFQDITERKHAEEQQNILLREMSHRVTNLFAVIGGLVALSARSARTSEEMATSIRDRLDALARAHELVRPGLIATGEKENRHATLDALLRAIFSPYVDTKRAGDDERVTLSGPDVPIGGTAATSLALVLHELATNAAKYGGLSSAEGSVEIDWSLESGKLLLRWEERDGPLLDGPPAREGFGSVLARRSVENQLGGQLSSDWTPEGLLIHLSMPVERLTM